MSPGVVPEGFVALRVKLDDEAYDLIVEDRIGRLLVEQHGGEILTDNGLTVSDLRQVLIVDNSERLLPSMRDQLSALVARLPQLNPVPHLQIREYFDRPPLDLGLLPRPVSLSTQRHRSPSKNRSKNRAKNKVARKSRRKNRLRAR